MISEFYQGNFCALKKCVVRPNENGMQIKTGLKEEQEKLSK
jgi:hypothetical protein